MSNNISQYIKSIADEKKYNEEYIKVLTDSLIKNEAGKSSVDNLIRILDKKYAESKKDKS